MSLGRPRTFDEAEILDRTLDLFWLRGFHSVGLTELVAHAGIGRQSLYDAFGSKRSLFIRSIVHYRDTRLAEALALLDREGSPLENVKGVMRFFRDLARDKRSRGCFVANSLVELSSDSEIRDLLEETLGMLEHRIRIALREAQKRGELASDADPGQQARALISAMIGLSVTGKLSPAQDVIDDIYEGTLRMLR